MKDPRTRANIFILVFVGVLWLILLLAVNSCENISIRSPNSNSQDPASVIEVVPQKPEKL